MSAPSFVYHRNLITIVIMLLFVAAHFALPASAFSQVSITPQSPVLGGEIQLTAGPKLPKVESGQSIAPTDAVFASMGTYHKGVFHRTSVPMKWDGSKFVAQFQVPKDCEYGDIGMFTIEDFYINGANFGFMPRTVEGSNPPGALILGMVFGRYDRKNWKSDIESDVSRMNDKGWIYKYIWSLRYQAMANIDPEALKAEIEKASKEVESPALLQSLAYGYFMIGQHKTGLEKLIRLCRTFPSSPYAVMGLHDANYLLFSHGFKEYDEQLKELYAHVANTAPDNEELWNDEANAVNDLRLNTEISLQNLRTICELWIKQRSTSYGPYLVLASALADRGSEGSEIERLATKAIAYSYLPTTEGFARDKHRGLAYRVRSLVRAQMGDLAGALADARIAQAFSPNADTDDIDAQAELWLKLGFPKRAEDTAVAAYRKGSLKAEGFIKRLYLTRTGQEKGADDYFIAKITADNNENVSTTNEIAIDKLPEAPVFKATTLEQQEVDSEKLKGSIVVLNFWFINCGPCRGEMPELNRIAEKYSGKVRFLAVASDDAADLKVFLKIHPFKYEIIPGNQWNTSRPFPIKAFPTHFIVDTSGKIVWGATGASPDNVEKLDAMLERLLKLP